MALAIHNTETLGEIADDLRAITERLETLREKMKSQGIKKLPIDYQKMQVKGRLWLHRFAADGHERLREAVAERTMKE